MRVDLEEKRKRRIRVVENTLDRALEAGISINHRNLVIEVMKRFDCSKRVAMEYVDTAGDKLGWIQGKVEGILELFHKSLPYDQLLNENSKEWNNLSEKDRKAIVEA